MTQLPTHIVAIGASAGGLEELMTFFDHTPCDGVAYVVVQHLSASFKSRMLELISKHSKLLVKEAENNMPVVANQVYLIPNDMYLTISNNTFFLTSKETTQGPHLTVDKFFKSLALNSQMKGIAVILSGLGADGTQGLKAIKAAGGIGIARNPENTEFGSMPSNAIATGLIDFILEPEFMPSAIEEYLRYGAEALVDSPAEEKQIAIIIGLVAGEVPFDFTNYKHNTIIRRIRRRISFNNFTRIESYIEFLKKNPAELKALAQDFLISVTSFFRDPEAYQYLETHVVPAILESLVPGEEVKIWVPGCATGEEAYSLAILFCEQLKNAYADVVVKIFATDIDGVALIHAGKGIYSNAIEKNVSAARLERHFIQEGVNYKIKPDIRKMLIFAPHDLVKNPPYCNMHLISCRNILIYMNSTLQKKIFSMLLFGLRYKGYLFLGTSENPQYIAEHLEVLHKKWRIFKNIQTKRVINFEGYSLPQMVDIGENKIPVQRSPPPDTGRTSLTEAIAAALAVEMNYLALAIDENDLVIKTFGDTSRYLLQKNFNLHLPELLPRPLSVAFNTASIKAKQTKEQARLSNININSGGKAIKVQISVRPLSIRNSPDPVYMVIISEDAAQPPVLHAAGGLDEKIYLDDYTLMIEEELNDLKDKLRNTYKQLDASNDNMQSYIEELLSANEEMQSTNEEMQSVNEELQTINTEYQLKNKALLDLNDDLNNYFRSNLHGQLFVNADLLLMKFSPATADLINLLPTDIGRPLNHISTNIKFETIVADIRKVMSTGETIREEIETRDGAWYQVMTMPYIQLADQKQTGAIVTFNEISALKNIQKELDKRNQTLTRINEDLDNFVTTASHDLLAPLANIEMSISLMNSIETADPELKKFLSIINLSIQKFRGLIMEISAVARIENDAFTKEKVDLEEIITNIEWSLDDKIRESKAVISRNLEVSKISFSKKNLRSILYNLISNAVKFRSERPLQIKVTSFQTPDATIIIVEDNGIGMTPGEAEKIWGMYYRLSHDIEGQGIGMFLTKKIINAADGHISVDTVAGKGSKFIVSLPL